MFLPAGHHLSSPRVTVLMSVHNGQAYLREAIDSILGQTFRDFEFLIIDDGSRDDSPKILREYADKDPRIYFLRQENQGLTKSLNRGLQLARGELIARMDSDDICLPERLNRQVEYFENTPEAIVCGCQAQLINDRGEIIGSMRYACDDLTIKWKLLTDSHFPHPGVMFRRRAGEAVGGYDEKLPFAQDYDLWLRLLPLGKMANLPDTLLYYRRHSCSISTSRFVQQQQLRSAISERGLCNLQFALSPAEAQRFIMVENGGCGDGSLSVQAYGHILERFLHWELEHGTLPTQIDAFRVQLRWKFLFRAQRMSWLAWQKYFWLKLAVEVDPRTLEISNLWDKAMTRIRSSWTQVG